MPTRLPRCCHPSGTMRTPGSHVDAPVMLRDEQQIGASPRAAPRRRDRGSAGRPPDSSPFGSPPNRLARAARHDRADQVRSPRCWAASSSPAVSVRSTIGSCVSPPRRSLRYRPHALQIASSYPRYGDGMRTSVGGALCAAAEAAAIARCATSCRTASRRDSGARRSEARDRATRRSTDTCGRFQRERRYAVHHVARSARQDRVADDAGDAPREAQRRIDRRRFGVRPTREPTPSRSTRNRSIAADSASTRCPASSNAVAVCVNACRQIARVVEKRRTRRTRASRPNARARAFDVDASRIRARCIARCTSTTGRSCSASVRLATVGRRVETITR